jgi:2,4-dienoyl-CoA reductase-like NADH-dependent reductase (Old Yellow Enzyme family)
MPEIKVDTEALLSSFSLRDLLLKNRVVMSPLTRSRAGTERLANALMAEYYAQRASAGLIISEATVISQQAIGWLNSPGIYTDEQAEAWKEVVAAVHAQGAPIFLQLWHCGRASHSSFHEQEGLPVAPADAEAATMPRAGIALSEPDLVGPLQELREMLKCVHYPEAATYGDR